MVVIVALGVTVVAVVEVVVVVVFAAAVAAVVIAVEVAIEALIIVMILELVYIFTFRKGDEVRSVSYVERQTSYQRSAGQLDQGIALRSGH